MPVRMAPAPSRMPTVVADEPVSGREPAPGPSFPARPGVACPGGADATSAVGGLTPVVPPPPCVGVTPVGVVSAGTDPPGFGGSTSTTSVVVVAVVAGVVVPGAPVVGTVVVTAVVSGLVVGGVEVDGALDAGGVVAGVVVTGVVVTGVVVTGVVVTGVVVTGVVVAGVVVVVTTVWGTQFPWPVLVCVTPLLQVALIVKEVPLKTTVAVPSWGSPGVFAPIDPLGPCGLVNVIGLFSELTTVQVLVARSVHEIVV